MVKKIGGVDLFAVTMMTALACLSLLVACPGGQTDVSLNNSTDPEYDAGDGIYDVTPGEPDAGDPDATGDLDAGDEDVGTDAGALDTGEEDADETEDAGDDVGEPDAGEPDAGEPDTGEPDAGEPECESTEEYCEEADGGSGGCVDLQNDIEHCGDCGEGCEVPDNGSAVCEMGTCDTTCNPGFFPCDDGDICVDIATDPEYCGDCDTSCDSGQVCSDHTCSEECESGETNCSGACVDTETNVNHCGGCGDYCHNPLSGDPVCEGGQCGVDCDQGWSECGDTCVQENVEDDFDVCDDECTHIASDIEHCGECDNECTDAPSNASPDCYNGECGFECDSDYQPCGDECISESATCESCDPDFSGDFGGGQGTSESPYLLCSAEHLMEIGAMTDPHSYFAVMDHIDLNDLEGSTEFHPIGTTFAGEFDGSFNGNGHRIENLSLDVDSNNVGLFTSTGTDGEIYDLELVDVDVQSEESRVGGLVGHNQGTIFEVEVSGLVATETNLVGGLAGSNTGSITDVAVYGEVRSAVDPGGLAAGLVAHNEGTIADSESHADIISDGPEGAYTGGLVGLNDDNAEVDNSFAYGDVIAGAADEDQDQVGGLVGENRGAITDSEAHGNVQGINHVGGLVGTHLEGGQIANSEARGQVDGESVVGGLVGYSAGEIVDSDAYGEVEASGAYVGGLVGQATSSSHIENATAQETVTGGDQIVGGLAGYNAGTIENSSAEGDVFAAGNHAGGLVGLTGENSDIKNVVAYGDVDGDDTTVGGLVGTNSGALEGAEAEGSVSGVGSSNPNVPAGVGGLAGTNSSTGTIVDSSATGNVTGKGNENRIGGLVGDHWGALGNVSADGDVQGNADYVGGAIGRIRTTSSVNNVHASGTVDGGGDWIGGLAGVNPGGITISDSTASGAVTGDGDHIGGLVGQNSGTIEDCTSTSTVEGGGDNTGGLAGSNAGVIVTSSAEGDVVGGENWIGGLVGLNGSSGTIRESRAIGDVDVSAAGRVGGLAGSNAGTVSNSYAGGAVTGDQYVGGLVGRLSGDESEVEFSHSFGRVVGNTVTGGLIGQAHVDSETTASYWDNVSSEQEESAAGESRTTTEFGQEGSFSNWDFGSGGTWTISTAIDNTDRPVLTWE